jgi:exopolysaccharide biosynthesis polyprenyl glycosylphosphotransferase
MLAAGDAVAVGLALFGALLIGGRAHLASRLAWGLIALPLLILLFKIYGLYDRDMKRINHSTADDLPWLFHAVVIGTLLLWLYAKVTPMHRLDFAEVLFFGWLVLLLLTGLRSGVRRAAASLLKAQRALMVGGGTMASVLLGKLAAHPEYRLKVVGLISSHRESAAPIPELPPLGTVDELEELASRHDVARLIVSPTNLDDGELEGILKRCRDLSLKLSLIPKLSDVLGPAVEVDDVEGVTVLGVNPPWLPRSSRALKRTMDVVLSAVLLVLLAPLLAVVALAVKLDSSGPMLFAQERVGRGGRRFRLLKFRTMTSDAEQRRDELLGQSNDPSWLKLEYDPRVTRLGRFLRRLSIDELPQLWNVLRGEMSMVGPRPLIEAEDVHVKDWARRRLDLTPGLTGYWQVLGRTRIPFDEMVKLDYLYVMNWSLWNDIRLMLRTLPVVLSGRGAN